MTKAQIQAQIDLVNAQLASVAAQLTVSQKQNAMQVANLNAQLTKLAAQLEAAPS